MPARTHSAPLSKLATVPFGVLWGSGGSAIRAFQNVQSGQYLSPFTFPEWADPSRPTYVWSWITNNIANAAPGLIVAFELAITKQSPGTAMISTLYPLPWPVPNPWPANTIQRILLATLPGGEFTPKMLIGMRHLRSGSPGTDTYPSQINIIHDLEIIFSERCLARGCL